MSETTDVEAAESPVEGSSDDSITPAFLTEIRTDRRRRYAALGVAVVLGVAVAWLHWLGLLAAGSLVGLFSRDIRRAALAGLGVGILALALNVLASPAMNVGSFLALTPPAYVAVAAGLALPVWGSLVRGVV